MSYQYRKSASPLQYIIFFIITFAFGWFSAGLNTEHSVEAQKEDVESYVFELRNEVDLDLYWTVWEELTNKYYEQDLLDESSMVYGSIKGMVDSLNDPYTVFMTPEESEEFTSSLDGTLEGIGAELTVEDQQLIVVAPLRKSPAEKAGLLPGDIIYKIEGELSAEMNLIDAIMNIRGEKGTTVTLTIIREAVTEPFDVSIVRDSIDIESVTVEEMDGGIIYLSVNQFNDKTKDEFGNAISEMILSDPNGLIVDLRYNGGGYLNIAVDLLSYLLPSKTLAVTLKETVDTSSSSNTSSTITSEGEGEGEGDGKTSTNKYYTNGNPKVLDVPLVVIINESSASASEIVAGAIQDHQRGIVFGNQSFGKGTVQEVETFLDGSIIRLTVAKWFTPDGRDIDENGITPDIIVDITEEDIINEYDAQKEAAIEYLNNL